MCAGKVYLKLSDDIFLVLLNVLAARQLKRAAEVHETTEGFHFLQRSIKYLHFTIDCSCSLKK